MNRLCCSLALGLPTLWLLLLGDWSRPARVLAVPNDNRPKILLHLKPATRTEPCQYGQLTDCRYANTSAGLSGHSGPFYFAYLLAARGRVESLYRMRCGITYQKGFAGGARDGRGIDVLSWNLCADVQYASPGGPLWPAPGAGSLIYWDPGQNCQRGETAVAGYFYVAAYDPDTLRVIRDPTDHLVDFFKCESGSEFLGPEDLGWVTFSAGGAAAGCNPCKEDCSGLPPPADYRDPSLVLHVAPPTGGREACAAGLPLNCNAATTKGSLVTTPEGPFYFVYLLAHQGNVRSVGGFRCGLGYELNRPGDATNGRGIDIYDWNLCADHQIINTLLPPWPSPGGGITVYWDTPAPTAASETQVAGYFYVGAYSADNLRLTRHGIFGFADLFERNYRSTPLSPAQLGVATFSGGAKADGCNPCRGDCSDRVTAVLPSTWSGIKALYAPRAAPGSVTPQ